MCHVSLLYNLLSGGGVHAEDFMLLFYLLVSWHVHNMLLAIDLSFT